jgi:hypothetical protein
MFANSEEREETNTPSFDDANSLHESEMIEKRGKQKESLKKQEKVKDSDLKHPKKNMPVLIKVLSIFHICVIAILFYFSIHFYSQYIDFKTDSEEFDIPSIIRIAKALLCIAFGCFFAFSRAILIENYY